VGVASGPGDPQRLVPVEVLDTRRQVAVGGDLAGGTAIRRPVRDMRASIVGVRALMHVRSAATCSLRGRSGLPAATPDTRRGPQAVEQGGARPVDARRHSLRLRARMRRTVADGRTDGRVGGSTVVVGWGLGAALMILVGLAVAVSAAGSLGLSGSAATAAARAALQLAVISVVIVSVVGSLWLSAGFVLLMFTTATLTSGRRITPERSGLLAVVPIAAGTVPVLAVVIGAGAVPLTGIALVPVSGIVIGGAMTATSVAGRPALDELGSRYGEYEAGLSLGLRERDAALEVARPSAAQALVPPLDQTRTVGLVTLPGAFVGVLIGSGDPVQAGAAQLLVLIGLLAAESVAVVITLELVARGRIRRPRLATTS
jgi:UDP-glucose/iron transport system permease protein